MAYVSLYRKYRPQTFAEIVGQRHVTQTLANAIAEDRLHHAYLFTGPRGTGKTSTARILAKAVNCERGPTPEPCATCEVCVSIADGSAVDVVELDMASHGGVDDARDLRERALFAPARARRKVYILDEVHMASSAAFNALLKLIEEPPGHVLFAMATTDPQKVLPTIMSRVQRLDLRRVGASEVAEHVRRLCSLEEVAIDDAAVDAVVRAGEGSVRDTLSILEQVLAFSGRQVTADDVAQLLGHTPADLVLTAVDLLADGDLGGLYGLVGDLLDAGIDLRRFALDLTAHVRDLLVLQVAPERPDLVDVPPGHLDRLQAQAPRLPRATLLEAVDVLAGTVAEMRRGPARLPLELALAKLALPTTTGPTGASSGAAGRPPEASGGASGREAARAAVAAATARRSPGSDPAGASQRSEPASSAPAGAPEDAASSDPEAAASASSAPAEAREAASSTAPQAGVADGDDGDTGDRLDEVRSAWPRVLDAVKRQSPRVHAYYSPATPVAVDGGVLVLAYPPHLASFHPEEAVKTENVEVLAASMQEIVGTPFRVGTRIAGDGPSEESTDEAPERVTMREDEVAVIEAESTDAPVDLDEALDRAEALLRDELGARPVDDQGAR